VTVTLIAAVARNGVIGADGGIPWKVPGEQAFFRDATMGHTLAMGRATYESIGRALPGRTTIVVTRDPDWAADGVLVASSPEEALGMAAGDVYVAGGATIYAATIGSADVLMVSEIDLEPDGDTFFPEIDRDTWTEVSREPHEGFTVVRWERLAG
jgi:dihydrofolate reductase